MKNKMNLKRLNRLLSYLFNEMKDLDDKDRDLPIRWSIMHMYTSSQVAKIIAIKRGLDPELAGMIACLHDIAIIKTKRRKNHAENAKLYIEDIISHYNQNLRSTLPLINDNEKVIIIEAVTQHSLKEEKTSKPYVELMKDVDSFDRFLHGVKTEEEYLTRTINVKKDLNLLK